VCSGLKINRHYSVVWVWGLYVRVHEIIYCLFFIRAGVYIAEALVFNSTLTYLDLSGNLLGPEVGVAIGQMLLHECVCIKIL